MRWEDLISVIVDNMLEDSKAFWLGGLFRLLGVVLVYAEV